MTTENSSPISGQRPAIAMLDSLSSTFPQLPDAYTIIHQPFKGMPLRLQLLLDTPDAFEQWRTALGISPATVHLHPNGRGSWVEAETVRESIRVDISAHGILLTEDQLSAPRIREDVAA